jgi:hypothetical protein
MIRLGGLVSQKAFGKFEMGKVISNPFANAFVNEAEGEDHEVSMGQNQLDTIIKMATELKAKMGDNEKEIPAWIQDHISKAENYISQAAGNYHEYGTNESVNEAFNIKVLPTWLFDDADDFEYWYEHGMTLGGGRGKIAPFNSSDDKKLEALVEKWKDAEYDYQHGRGDLGTGKTTGARAASYAAQDAIKQLFKQKAKIVKNESIKEASPCWKGYKQVGMKDKGGRQVPNCVPNESVVNEATYNFGKEEYTKKNLTPTQIQDLAFGYVQTPITKLVGKTLGHRVNLANDLARLTGTKQLDAKARGKESALIMVLLKNKLISKEEYIQMYKDLIEKHQQVIKYLKNASPEMRNSGGAARAAAKDMKGEFDMD